MTTSNPYFGTNEDYSKTPHAPAPNKVFSHASLEGSTLEFKLDVSNSGIRAASVNINLFARWFNLEEASDKSTDALALITMNGLPLVQWALQDVPMSTKPGWSSGECRCTVPQLGGADRHKARPHEQALIVVATLYCPEVGLGPTSPKPTRDQCVAVQTIGLQRPEDKC